MGGVRKTVKHPYGYDHTDAFTCLEYLFPFLVLSVLYMGGYSPQGGEEKKEVKAYAHPYRKYDYGIQGSAAASKQSKLRSEYGVDYIPKVGLNMDLNTIHAADMDTAI